MGRLFYRIVRSAAPTIDDFKTARDLGKQLRFPQFRREWEEAISVFDDFDHAVNRAIKSRLQLGDHIAELDVPDDGSVEFAPTAVDPRHYSIYAAPELIMTFVTGPATRVATIRKAPR